MHNDFNGINIKIHWDIYFSVADGDGGSVGKSFGFKSDEDNFSGAKRYINVNISL